MKVGVESERLEFKKTTAELNEGIISIVAILNKHGGGELYFGVHNDGTPLGMDISGKTMRDVSQALSQHLEPKIFPRITDVYFDEKHCIHIVFHGDEGPYYAFGRAYIRVADTDKKMSASELEKFILQKNERKNTWDAAISERTIDEVNEDALKDFLIKANQAKRIDFTYSTKEEVLKRLRLVKFGHVVNAANVLFCEPADLEVQMATFATAEKLTFLDIDRQRGRLGELIDACERYIRKTVKWRVVLDGSIQRKEIPEVPMDAVREALINSYCHRDYQSFQNNEVLIFKNRIEIYNPGTFPFGMTPEDYIKGEEPSIKRNPRLADLMYYTKDIESFGTGLRRISRACEEAGVKVEFRLMKMGFAVVFYRPFDHTTGHIDETDHGMTSDPINANEPISDPTNDTNDPINDPINHNKSTGDSINERQKDILICLKNDNSATYEVLSKSTGVSVATIKRDLKRLQENGIIRRVGSKKDGYWEIVENITSYSAGKPGLT